MQFLSREETFMSPPAAMIMSISNSGNSRAPPASANALVDLTASSLSSPSWAVR